MTVITYLNICYDTNMPLRLTLKIIGDVLAQYRLFTAVLVIVLILVLIRIPLGTFNYPSFIDTVAHALLPLSAAPLVFAMLRQSGFLPHLSTRGSIFLILLIGTMLEVIWEMIEFVVDISLGLNWQLSNTDTMIDLILAVAGSLCGGYLLIKLYARSFK